MHLSTLADRDRGSVAWEHCEDTPAPAHSGSSADTHGRTRRLQLPPPLPPPDAQSCSAASPPTYCCPQKAQVRHTPPPARRLLRTAPMPRTSARDCHTSRACPTIARSVGRDQKVDRVDITSLFPLPPSSPSSPPLRRISAGSADSWPSRQAASGVRSSSYAHSRTPQSHPRSAPLCRTIRVTEPPSRTPQSVAAAVPPGRLDKRSLQRQYAHRNHSSVSHGL